MASNLKIRHFTNEAAMILLFCVQELLPFTVWQNNILYQATSREKFRALEVRLLLVLLLRRIFRS